MSWECLPADVVPGRLELPTSTLSVWRSDRLSYRTGMRRLPKGIPAAGKKPHKYVIIHTAKNSIKRAKGKNLPEPSGQKTDNRSRKEVFQPHLPVRLPCYDLAPITSFTLGRTSRKRTSGAPGFHGLTGGVYKARERIHRAMADARLLANPASWGRVADPNPN